MHPILITWWKHYVKKQIENAYRIMNPAFDARFDLIAVFPSCLEKG
jgi:hypothetical protein